jgi:hypothetical protein
MATRVAVDGQWRDKSGVKSPKKKIENMVLLELGILDIIFDFSISLTFSDLFP